MPKQFSGADGNKRSFNVFSPAPKPRRSYAKRLTNMVAVGALTIIVSACGDGGDPTGVTTSSPGGEGLPTPSTVTPPSSQPDGGPVIAVTVSNGDVATERRTYEVSRGDEVTIRTTSDAGDELHVHGYDERMLLTPGVPATLTFVADIPGSFEVELEELGTLLFELQVR